MQASQHLSIGLPKQKPTGAKRHYAVATNILEEDLYPVGGFSSIANRGTMESLLRPNWRIWKSTSVQICSTSSMLAMSSCIMRATKINSSVDVSRSCSCWMQAYRWLELKIQVRLATHRAHHGLSSCHGQGLSLIGWLAIR